MRKLLTAAAVAALLAGSAVPAGAGHPAAITVAHAFAGTCSGTPNDGGPASGACVFGRDAVWDAAGAVAGPAGCKGGTDTTGCGTGVYLPGLGPPISRPATAFDPRGRCTNGLDTACWRGGNYLYTTAHSAAACLIVRGTTSGAASACELTSQGSFYRPATGLGAYSGSSEGCGRIRIETGSDVAVLDLSWTHSAGTILPIMYRSVSPGHSGTVNAYEITNARPIRAELGEPPGLGNGGLPSSDPAQGPGRSGTRRFGVTSINVALPGDGPDAPAGPGASLRCVQF